MNPVPGVERGISRRHAADGKPQHGIEGSHWVKPSVEPEDIFIEIRLQMVLGDSAVMGPENPGFQIGKDQVDHGQVSIGFFGVASNG